MTENKFISDAPTACEKKPVRIGIIGLGYVGLPLALAWGRYFPTIGFDSDHERIRELKEGMDKNRENCSEIIKTSYSLVFTDEKNLLADCSVYVVTVPTPVDKHNNPDLKPLKEATELISRFLKQGDTVIFESTVYPGCTEEFCVPLLEQKSGLQYNKDFFCGYSPERMNPGDGAHRLTEVVKLVSGSTPEAAFFVEGLYKKIITAGVYRTPDIKTAEAAKVLENTQRDVNIAFMNEMAMLFSSLDINTEEVLKASRTRWNFVDFRPGLVGGHCVSVDPWWLVWRAEEAGFHPRLILEARLRNEEMSGFLAQKTIKELAKRGISPLGAKVLLFGFTFKENCADIRNTKIASLVREFESCGCCCIVVDPLCDREKALAEYGIPVYEFAPPECREACSAVLGVVAHKEFQGILPTDFLTSNGFVFDIKGIFQGFSSVISL